MKIIKKVSCVQKHVIFLANSFHRDFCYHLKMSILKITKIYKLCKTTLLHVSYLVFFFFYLVFF